MVSSVADSMNKDSGCASPRPSNEPGRGGAFPPGFCLASLIAFTGRSILSELLKPYKNQQSTSELDVSWMWMDTININPDFDWVLFLIKTSDSHVMVLGPVRAARELGAIFNGRVSGWLVWFISPAPPRRTFSSGRASAWVATSKYRTFSSPGGRLIRSQDLDRPGGFSGPDDSFEWRSWGSLPGRSQPARALRVRSPDRAFSGPLLFSPKFSFRTDTDCQLF